MYRWWNIVLVEKSKCTWNTCIEAYVLTKKNTCTKKQVYKKRQVEACVNDRTRKQVYTKYVRYKHRRQKILAQIKQICMNNTSSHKYHQSTVRRGYMHRQKQKHDQNTKTKILLRTVDKSWNMTYLHAFWRDFIGVVLHFMSNYT